jgi:ribosome-associated protein
MEEFDLEGGEYVELNSLLKLTGLCSSGGIAKMMIAEGNVLVDGQVELRKRCKIRSGQQVEFDGQQISIA